MAARVTLRAGKRKGPASRAPSSCKDGLEISAAAGAVRIGAAAGIRTAATAAAVVIRIIGAAITAGIGAGTVIRIIRAAIAGLRLGLGRGIGRIAKQVDAGHGAVSESHEHQ